MIRHGALLSLLLLEGCLTGCITQEKKVVDSEITRHLAGSQPKRITACHSMAVEVLDGRIDTSLGAAVGLDATMVNAGGVLATEFERAGLTVRNDAADVPVKITLKRIYLSQQYESRSFNVVANVEVAGKPAKMIRSSETGVAWSGSVEESEKAMAKVFRSLAGQVVEYLDSNCLVNKTARSMN